MSIVFVNSRRAIRSKRGSWKIRGESVACMLGAYTASCDDDIHSFLPIRVMVHVKNPCLNFLNVSKYNVYDATDNKKFVNASRFDAQITANPLKVCGSRICIRIPHHDNLNCKVHSNARKESLSTRRIVIGIVGNEPTITRMSGYHVLLEKDFAQPCVFFDRINIAIAWKKKASLFQLPCERFTNPISWNIPTVGYAYASYKNYHQARPFVCTDSKCVHETIRNITIGKLDTQFRALRREVVKDTSPARILHLYRLLFSQLS